MRVRLPFTKNTQTFFFLIIGILAVTFISGKSAFALPFNNKITDSDKTALNAGSVLVRSIDKYKNAALQSDAPIAKKFLQEIKDVAPNYLAEMIQLRPYNENEDLLDKMESVLLDIPHYVGIPYWSEQHQRFWDLYEKADILSEKDLTFDDITDSTKSHEYTCNLYMEPFGDIPSTITYIRGADYLFFVNENSKGLKLKGINAISKNKMKSTILVFRDGSNWVLYALGGCKTFKIAGFQKRIETSLINRIKTFVNYVFKKMDGDTN